MPTPPIRPIGPLTGVLDLRSSPDEMPEKSLRMRQNFQTTGEGKLRRGSGFRKLLSQANYNNSDFHDQLLALSGASGRQPVTMLYEGESTRRVRSLYVATQRTIAQLNAHSGNYRILGSGFGGTFSTSAMAPRFRAATQGDYVLFTNDHDKVQYVRQEQAADPVTGQFIYTIDELDTIGLSRAKVIFQWKSVIFLANVTMDGERVTNRIVWSDFDNPVGVGSFDPAEPGSITGFKDFETYEEILAAAPTGNTYLIYTTHGIWEMVAVGGDQSFDFRRVYNGEKDEYKAVLAYPNTLVNLHDSHCYVGRDGVYFFGAYYPAPDRPEWLHRATSDMLDSIDKTACDAHVAGLYGDEIYFSVARVGASNQCPDYTLRANKTYRVADVVDAHMVTYAQFSPQDIATVRDFIVEQGLCTVAGLAAQGYPYGKEGLPRSLPQSPVDEHGYYVIPEHFYSNDVRTNHVGHYYIPTEDWEGVPEVGSLCDQLQGETFDELCRLCKPDPLFLGVSSVDWCVKEIGKVYYRERCTNPGAVGVIDANGYTAAVGTYLLDSIASLLRFAPAFAMDAIIKLSKLELKLFPSKENAPPGVSLRVGISGQPADSNEGTGIVFHQHSTKPVTFVTQKNQAQHLAGNTQPTGRCLWTLEREGRFLHLELSIVGTGADIILSAIEPEMAVKSRTRNY